ncbi:MAG: 30S ribosomal protein S9 [Candidatus Micrarchaeaceae archaeon]
MDENATSKEAVLPAQQVQQAQQLQPGQQAQPLQPAQERPKKAAARKKVPKKVKVVLSRSKRKEAIARASLKAGKGSITVNGFSIDTIEPQELKYIMLEPLTVSKLASALSKKVDIAITVRGGGISAQAQAIRGAIAKGISAYADSDVIHKELMNYDRSMLVDDSRRVEPKKFKGPKARARFQTSYR